MASKMVKCKYPKICGVSHHRPRTQCKGAVSKVHTPAIEGVAGAVRRFLPATKTDFGYEDYSYLAKLVQTHIAATKIHSSVEEVDGVVVAVAEGLKGTIKDGFKVRRLYVQTEENPDVGVVADMFKKMTNDTKSNFAGVLCSSGGPATLYGYRFRSEPTASKYRAFVEICKGRSGSTVDYVTFYERGGKLSVYALEATKTKPSQSGNAVSQRMGKMFWVREHVNGDVTTIIMFGDVDENMGEVSRAWKRDLSIIASNGVEVSGLPEGEVLKTVKNLEELSELEGSVGISEKNIRIRVDVRPDSSRVVYIKAKLSKNGKPENDPNIGFVTGIAQLVRTMDEPDRDAEIVVVGHGLEEVLERGGRKPLSGKLFRAMSSLNITLDNVDMNKLNSRVDHSKDEEEYYVPATGEKAGSILIHQALLNSLAGVEGGRYVTVFHNHAGSGLSDFFDPNGVRYQIKNKMSKIPDFVVFDKETGSLIIFEGKTAAAAKVGDEDLDKLDDDGGFIEQYCNKYYKDVPVVKMLTTYGSKPPKSTKYPCIHVYPDGLVNYINMP